MPAESLRQDVPTTSAIVAFYRRQFGVMPVAQAEEQLKAEKRLIPSLQQTVSAQSVELAAVESRVVKLFQHAADTQCGTFPGIRKWYAYHFLQENQNKYGKLL